MLAGVKQKGSVVVVVSIMIFIIVVMAVILIFTDSKAEKKEVQNTNIQESVTIEIETQTQYSALLRDVTGGKEIDGLKFDPSISGVAKAIFSDRGYILTASFEGLPEPVDDGFYEGWIVRKSPFKVLSTGEAKNIRGVYINSYTSSEDMLDFKTYVLTLEKDDGNPAPASHVLEGLFEKEEFIDTRN